MAVLGALSPDRTTSPYCRSTCDRISSVTGIWYSADQGSAGVRGGVVLPAHPLTVATTNVQNAILLERIMRAIV